MLYHLPSADRLRRHRHDVVIILVGREWIVAQIGVTIRPGDGQRELTFWPTSALGIEHRVPSSPQLWRHLRDSATSRPDHCRQTQGYCLPAELPQAFVRDPECGGLTNSGARAGWRAPRRWRRRARLPPGITQLPPGFDKSGPAD